jgi:hypothetical protein
MLLINITVLVERFDIQTVTGKEDILNPPGLSIR